MDKNILKSGEQVVHLHISQSNEKPAPKSFLSNVKDGIAKALGVLIVSVVVTILVKIYGTLPKDFSVENLSSHSLREMASRLVEPFADSNSAQGGSGVNEQGGSGQPDVVGGGPVPDVSTGAGKPDASTGHKKSDGGGGGPAPDGGSGGFTFDMRVGGPRAHGGSAK